VRDGEEPVLLGSTEWGEQHAAELTERAAANINSDVNGKAFWPWADLIRWNILPTKRRGMLLIRSANCLCNTVTARRAECVWHGRGEADGAREARFRWWPRLLGF
jgi:hypothetical protein